MGWRSGRRPRRVAIVRLSAIGDAVLIVPLVETLKRALPGVEITWVIGREAYGIVEGLPGVEFIVIDKPRCARHYMEFASRMRGRYFDVVLGLHSSFRSNTLYPLMPAGVKIGYDHQRSRGFQWFFMNRKIPYARQNLLDRFFSFLEALGIDGRVERWELPIGPEDDAWVQQQIPGGRGPVVAIHPAASRPERNLATERYSLLADEIVERWGGRVVLTGGCDPAERQLGEAVRSGARSKPTNLVGRTTLKQMAAVLKRADCVVAPDTCAIHIAGALGTPVVGLYAVAPSWLTGGWASPELVIDHFSEAARRFAGWRGQNFRWRWRVHDPRCMSLIQPEEVLEKLALVLDRKKQPRDAPEPVSVDQEDDCGRLAIGNAPNASGW